MSDASAVLAPPPFKNRRGWLIAFGVVEILIGCFFLLMIAFALFALMSSTPPQNGPVDPKAAIAMVVMMYGVGAIVFVVVGIGSVQARRWGRIASLVVSWCWLVFGVLTTAMMAVLLPSIMKGAIQGAARAPIPASAQSAIVIGMLTFFAIFFVALPLVFVLFYSGKNVKATCENTSGTPLSVNRKPVPVIVAAVWFGFSALSCLFVLVVPAGYPLFGVVLKGWAGRAAASIIAAACAWIAWNLYQQRLVGWRVAIGWLVVGWASMIVTQSRLGLAEMYRQMGYSEADLGRIIPFVNYGLYVAMLAGVAFLVFLLVIRKHFHNADTESLPS